MSRRPNRIGDYAPDVSWDGKPAGQAVRVAFASVDFGFTKTVGLKLAAGRDFSPSVAFDLRRGFLVNEEAAKLMGRTDVLGASPAQSGAELSELMMME